MTTCSDSSSLFKNIQSRSYKFLIGLVTLLGLCFISSTPVLSQTISKDTLYPLNYHAFDTVRVYYSTTGTFNSGNIFNLQLSDGTGSFASPVNIGQTTIYNPIYGIIPLSTPSGTGYRVRVVSSDPVVIGPDNNDDITITANIPTISKDTLFPLNYTAGDTAKVYYSKTGIFNGGNIFTVQLSSDSGSFASPVTLGQGPSPIFAIIPTNTKTGTHYRMRVVSSNPVVIGMDNLSDITITAKKTSTGFGGKWDVTSTWATGVTPTVSDNVVIGTVDTGKVIISGHFTVADLAIAPGGTLEIEANSSLTLTGNLDLQALLSDFGKIKGDGTLRLAGSAAQSITGLNGTSLNNLVIDNVSGISLSSANPLLINKSLNFVHGKLSTGTGKVILPFDATVTASQNTGWINGNLQRNLPGTPPDPCLISFEVGDNSSYAPMQTTWHGLTGSGSGGSFRASTTGGNNAGIANSGLDATKSVTRTYSLNNDGATFLNYDLKLNYQPDQYPSGADPNKFFIAQTEDGGITWALHFSEICERTDKSTKACRLASNSDFIIGAPACELPVSAGADEDTYFGYTGDQSVSHTVTPNTGTPPYSFAWTLNRPLNCNKITSSGDETFAVAGGTCTGTNLCPATDTIGPTPVCTATGNSSTVTALLLDTGIVCVTVKDANGCIGIDCFTIKATDARCFSGKSGVQKVVVCHKTGNTKTPWVQLCVDEDAVPALLAAGDYPGKCTANHKEASEEAITRTEFIVYPNPAHQVLNIKFNSENADSYQIQLTDMTGRTLLNQENKTRQGSNDAQVDLNGLSSGIYILSVTNAEISQRIMVMVE